MPAAAREAAYRALRRLSSDRIDLGDALSRARDPLKDVRDRALTTELVIGTLRWRGAIDYQIQRFSDKPLHRLDVPVLDAVRLGAYQILYRERIPVSAIVNDTVTIVKSSGFRSAAGFVNAVLRRMARERDSLSWPARPTVIATEADQGALVDHLAVVASHPPWLIDRWITRYGMAHTEAWLKFNNTPPAMTVATNRLRGDRSALAARLRREGVATRSTSIASDGLIVTDGQVLSSPAFADGACVVQDEASQIIAEVVDADGGHRVLDACASPGGKTLALAAQAAAQGLVVAADVRPRRVRLLRQTLHRCGASMVHIVHTSDTDDLPFRAQSFDRVLVDAPCSGLGTVRRDPDIRWRRHPEDLPRFAAAQRELLRRVAVVVAPGGRLIYSTCSSEPEENEDVVRAFLAEEPGFNVVPVRELSGRDPAITRMTTSEGYLRTTPLFGLEAFFAAILLRGH